MNKLTPIYNLPKFELKTNERLLTFFAESILKCAAKQPNFKLLFKFSGPSVSRVNGSRQYGTPVS